MSIPITSGGITRCAVSLNGAPRKTIHLRLTGSANSTIVALQVDENEQVTSGTIISSEESNATFEFSHDGELWVFATGEDTAEPLSFTGGELSFTLGNTQVNLEVVPTEFNSRDVKTDVKVRVPDEV